DEGGGIVDFSARLADRLALFESHDPGKVFAMLADQVEPFLEQRGAAGGGGAGPVGEGAVGGVDRGAGAVAAAGRQRGEQRAVGRIGDLETGVAAGTVPAAVEEAAGADQPGVAEPPGKGMAPVVLELVNRHDPSWKRGSKAFAARVRAARETRAARRGKAGARIFAA